MSKAVEYLGRQPALGRHRFLRYEKCPICQGDMEIWSEEMPNQPPLFYSFHNRYRYISRNQLVKDCLALSKAREIKR